MERIDRLPNDICGVLRQIYYKLYKNIPDKTNPLRIWLEFENKWWCNILSDIIY